jgi:MFS transporter, DHA2 family, multidrug resistance protein
VDWAGSDRTRVHAVLDGPDGVEPRRPSLSADLKPTSAELLWIVDIYGFLVAGSLITLGTLGDRIGRRKLLMIGAAVFGFASVLAAFSTSAAMLIATRAYVIAGGMTVTALGFILLALVDKVDSSLAMLVAGSVVFSLGLTPVVTLTTDIVLSAALPERAGAASALSETSSEFGGALGIAVLGSIVTAIYRGEIASAFPVGVPAEAAEIARGTIGGAVSVANDLPGVIGDELLGSARDAFSQAFGTTAVISAVMAIGVALLAVMLLRPVGARLRSTRIAN